MPFSLLDSASVFAAALARNLARIPEATSDSMAYNVSMSHGRRSD